MLPGRNLLACIVLGWLGSSLCPSAAMGQVIAMPFSSAGEEIAPSDDPLVANGPLTAGVLAEEEIATGTSSDAIPLLQIPARLFPGRLPADESAAESSLFDANTWNWQPLPEGLIYRPYMAGGREPRLAAEFVHNRDFGWLLDGTIGAQAGLVRYGTRDATFPEGWQLDVEAAAFPRLALEEGRTLVSSDFRVGMPLTFRRGCVESKLALYHLSSHLSDYYTWFGPFVPIYYSRDALVWGLAFRLRENWRLYGEADWAFHTTGASQPWQFQFGLDVGPTRPTGFRGAPFFAINSVIRQENDYSGNFTVQTGWQWRGAAGQSFRTGFHYFNGKSNQGQFFNEHEELIGMGLWYDF